MAKITLPCFIAFALLSSNIYAEGGSDRLIEKIEQRAKETQAKQKARDSSIDRTDKQNQKKN